MPKDQMKNTPIIFPKFKLTGPVLSMCRDNVTDNSTFEFEYCIVLYARIFNSKKQIN